MYLLYLDESGVTDPRPNQTSHYVMLGAAVHVGTWFGLSRRIRNLKRKYSRGGEDFELHGAWLLRSYREQSLISGFEALDYNARFHAVREWREVRKAEWSALSSKSRNQERKEFRLTEPYTHLTRAERSHLYYETLKVVGEYSRGITLFGEAIDKRHLAPSVDPIEEAFSRVVGRFERFLYENGLWGLLVVDHDPHQADRVAAMLHRFQQTDTHRGGVDRIIEAPFFLESHANACVQVADLCAYSLRRYVENGEHGPFELIFPKFYRQDAALCGLRHLTSPGCCCLVCSEPSRADSLPKRRRRRGGRRRRKSPLPDRMSFAGSIDTGDPNSSLTVDEVVYGRDRP